MPNRRRRTRTRRGNRALKFVQLNYDFSASFASASKVINYGDLGVDASRPSRVRSISLDAAICGATQYPTLFVSINSNDNELVAYSKPATLGVSPRNLTVHNYLATDFHQPASNEVVCNLSLKNYYNGQITVSGRVTLDVWKNDVTTVVKLIRSQEEAGSSSENSFHVVSGENAA